MTDPNQFEKQRQGARVRMRVPVEIRGTTAEGELLEESTHTSVVGELGAMIRTSRMLKVGTQVDVTNRFSQQTARFRVAWATKLGGGDLWEIGLESPRPLDDFWGVRFPPKQNPR